MIRVRPWTPHGRSLDSRPMDDGTEIQATPVVNGTKEDVKNSDADAIVLRILSGERIMMRDPPRPPASTRSAGSRTRSVELHTYRSCSLERWPKGRDLLKFVVKAKTAQVRGLRSCPRFHSCLPTFSQEFSRSLKPEPSEFGLSSFERFRSVLS